ncbi:MAG TPA: PQQ-binding-like beta-propeller repeat protein [Polyangiaceae bacterium]|nr:PQQ-binding-like beta-propeller repeat protein [Polyangiaceae bacterium]
MSGERGANAPEIGGPPGGRERDRYMLRLAFALVVFGSLPLGWVRGFSCGSHVLKELSGARLLADNPEAALLLAAFAFLPVALGWLAERSKRLGWRLACDVVSSALAAAGAFVCAVLPGAGLGRHTLLAPAWASVLALGASSLDALAEAAADLSRRRARRRPPEAERAPRFDGPSPYRDRRRAGAGARGPLARAHSTFGRAAGALAWRGRLAAAALARWRRGPRALALAALALGALWVHAGAARGAGLPPVHEKWRYEFGGHGPPREGQHFAGTEGGFLVTNRYAPHRVAKVDEASGRPLWSLDGAQGALLPRAAREPLWLIYDRPSGALLEEIDPANGVLLRTATLPDAASSLGQWYRRGGVLIRAQRDLLERFDPETGARLWASRPREQINEFQVALTLSAVWAPCGRERLCRFGAEDGTLGRWIDAPVVDFAALPDALYVLGPDRVEAYGPEGATPRWAETLRPGFRGQRLLASAGWVVVLAQTNVRPKPDYVLSAHRAGDGTVAWSRGNVPEHYLGYLGLGGDLLAYYSSAEAGVFVRDLARGGERKAMELSPKLVLSPDATGVSPPVPAGDPVVSGPWVFVPDSGQLVALRFD